MRIITGSLLLVWAVIAIAANASGRGDSITHQIGIDVRPSYAFSSFKDDVLRDMIHTDDAKRTKLASSYHLKYAFSFDADTEKGRFFPGSYQGIGLSVNDFANRHGLGVPVSVYVLQGAPMWRISRKLSLDYEWNFGVSFGWKPCRGGDDYTSIDTQSNLIVGSRVNAYINIGLMLRWHMPNNWSMSAGLDMTHFSNGNTSFPNPGVNLAGLRIGVSRSFGRQTPQTARHAKISEISDTTKDGRRRISYDLTAYGAWRKRVYRGGDTPVLLRGHFPVAGISFAPMYEVARIFRAGVSADFQWDRSTDLKRHYASGSDSDDIRFYRPPFFSQVCGGLSARAELVTPYMSVNCGIGYNFVGPPETRASYEMANLKIHLPKGMYLNIGYQLLNFSKQNNLMLGLGVRL